MEIKVNFGSRILFQMSKNNKELHTHRIDKAVIVSVREPSEAEFPVEYTVHDKGYVYGKNGKPVWGDVDTEIRGYGGWFWEPVANSDIVYHGPGWLEPEHIGCLLGVREPSRRNKSFTDKAVVIFDDTESKIEAIRENAAGYMVFEGKVWRPCEPGLVDILVG